MLYFVHYTCTLGYSSQRFSPQALAPSYLPSSAASLPLASSSSASSSSQVYTQQAFIMYLRHLFNNTNGVYQALMESIAQRCKLTENERKAIDPAVCAYSDMDILRQGINKCTCTHRSVHHKKTKTKQYSHANDDDHKCKFIYQ